MDQQVRPDSADADGDDYGHVMSTWPYLAITVAPPNQVRLVVTAHQLGASRFAGGRRK